MEILNKWFENRDYLLKVSGYSGDTKDYFERLNQKLNDIDLNEDVKHVYAKRNGPYELERLYLFYGKKVSIINLEGMDITVEDCYLSNLESVKYNFILNSDYKKKLTLYFKNKKLTFNPLQDTEPSRYQEYNDLLSDIYYLVK